MAWGSKTQISNAVTVDSTTYQDPSTAVTLNPGELAHVEVEDNPPATPGSVVIVGVFGTLDDSTENWDDTPLMEFIVDNTPDPNKLSFTVAGLYKFRLQYKLDTGTEAHAVTADYRKDGVSL